MEGYFKFLGEDGSLGFRTGRVYKLEVETGYKRLRVTYYSAAGNVYCVYQSWNSFFKNWSLENKKS